MSAPPPSSLRPATALVRVETPEPSHAALLEAELRLRAALEEVTALDVELEALSEALADFSREHDRVLTVPYGKLDRAERWVRGLQRLQEELRRLAGVLRHLPEAAPGRRGGVRRAGSRRADRRVGAGAGTGDDGWSPTDGARRADEAGEDDASGSDVVIADSREDEAKLLKRLFRRLARLLHPDLARDDAERARLNERMVQVNAAYDRGDRTTLELIAEQVGAGEPLDALTPEARLAHLERRIAALEQAARSLRQQRDALRTTATFRLSREAAHRREQGRDYFAESARELAEEEEAAIADGWHRLASLQRAARTFNSQWSDQMSNLPEGKAGKGVARAFDPVLESALVRRGMERLEQKRASADARALARALEEHAADAPWQVVLTLLAYFAERAVRPPEGLRTQDGWRARYESLRARHPDAPTFERALTHLPHQLELGMRTQRGQLHAGLQLKDRALLPGVAIALERESVATLARAVFLELGPELTCKACGVHRPALHLLQTRGLDELNALVCAACGAVHKRYWLFSRNDGLEALHPDALRLGLITEQAVRFGGATMGFQFLADQRPQLRVSELLARLWDCYFATYRVEVPRERLQLLHGQTVLRPTSLVPDGVLTARLAKGTAKPDPKDAPITSRVAVELLRARIERRFRPDP